MRAWRQTTDEYFSMLADRLALCRGIPGYCSVEFAKGPRLCKVISNICAPELQNQLSCTWRRLRRLLEIVL